MGNQDGENFSRKLQYWNILKHFFFSDEKSIIGHSILIPDLLDIADASNPMKKIVAQARKPTSTKHSKRSHVCDKPTNNAHF